MRGQNGSLCVNLGNAENGLVNSANPTRSVGYILDAVGNRTQVVDAGVSQTYVPDILNRYRRLMGSAVWRPPLLAEKCTHWAQGRRTMNVGAKFVAKDERDWRPAPAPNTSSLTTLRNAAKTCTACHLYKHATQTVFGEGPKGAKLMLLGEQPGDQEDLAGKPFIGPAGKILDRALKEAGIECDEVYVTSAVKTSGR